MDSVTCYCGGMQLIAAGPGVRMQPEQLCAAGMSEGERCAHLSATRIMRSRFLPSSLGLTPAGSEGKKMRQAARSLRTKSLSGGPSFSAAPPDRTCKQTQARGLSPCGPACSFRAYENCIQQHLLPRGCCDVVCLLRLPIRTGGAPDASPRWLSALLQAGHKPNLLTRHRRTCESRMDRKCMNNC